MSDRDDYRIGGFNVNGAGPSNPTPKPSGAREWTVEDLGFDGLWLSPADGGGSFDKDLCPLHVVERSALTACEAKLAEAETTRDKWKRILMETQEREDKVLRQLDEWKRKYEYEKQQYNMACEAGELHTAEVQAMQREINAARAECEAYKGLLGYSVSSENPPPKITARNVIADSLRAEAERLQAGHARMSDIAKEQAEVIRLLWLVAEAAKIDTLPRNNELIAALFELETALAGEG